MGFSVYHMEKGAGGSGGIGRHIDRVESPSGYNTFNHANRVNSLGNKYYILNIHCNKALPEAISDRIKEGYKKEKAIRKDAVRFQTHILTGSHEDMKRIFSGRDTQTAWIEANKDWMIKVYGQENIVRFTLHVDEKTPHIHAVTVPITSDGRLSAKDFANGKQALRDLQSDYARHMERFGLKRGLEHTGVKHETAQEYYAREKCITEYMQDPQIRPIEPRKSFLKTNIKEIAEQNKRLSFLLASFTEKLERQGKDLKYAQTSVQNAIEQNKQLTYAKDRLVEQETDKYKREIKKDLDEKNRAIESLQQQNQRQEKILNNPRELANRLKELKREEPKKRPDKGQRNDFGFRM